MFVFIVAVASWLVWTKVVSLNVKQEDGLLTILASQTALLSSRLIRVDLFTYYIRQVNGVKLADIMFVLLFVGLCANVKQEDKWLASETHTFKATDFNLTCIFQGTVRAWPGSRNPLKFTCRIYAL